MKQEDGSLHINVAGTASGGSTISGTVSAIEIDNTTRNVGIDISPARKLHINDTMRLEPRSSAPSGATSGDMYFDDSEDSLMVYNSSGWFKSETKLLLSINSNEMFTDAGTFDGLATAVTSTFRLQDIWAFRSYADSGSGRNSQFNLIMPDTYIDGRDIMVRMYWTLTGLFFSNVTVFWKVGVTNGSNTYNTGDGASAEYIDTTFNTGEPIFYDYNILNEDFTFDGSSMLSGRPISVNVIRDNSDTYTGTVYLSHVEVFMV